MPIKVLIAKPGLDGHDVGARVVCRALLDAGMDVRYSGLRQTPEQIAEAAAAEQVDVVGLSILSGAHLPLCRKVGEALRSRAVEALWVVGGNIPACDEDELRRLGVDGVFGVGSRFDEIVAFIEERAGE